MTSFLQKLGMGLKKSSNQIAEGLSNVFLRKRVDDKMLEDLEETLLSADLGVSVTTKIISRFSKEKFDKECDENEIKNALSSQISEIMKPCEKAFEINSNKKPFIILMAGVNGGGKLRQSVN